jgi:hypothetical protein
LSYDDNGQQQFAWKVKEDAWKNSPAWLGAAIHGLSGLLGLGLVVESGKLACRWKEARMPTF